MTLVQVDVLLRTVDATTPSTRDRALHKWYAIEGRMEKYHCESFIERSGSVDCDEGSQVGIELGEVIIGFKHGLPTCASDKLRELVRSV